MGIPGDGVDGGAGTDFGTEFVAHEEGSSEGSVHVGPNVVLSTDPGAFLDRVNGAGNRCPDGDVGEIGYLPSCETFLDF